jgi:hypothetical protein
MHHILVGDIRIGEENLVYIVLSYEGGQFLFGVDGDALGIEGPRQFWRVGSAFDIGDLGGGEGYDIVVWLSRK